MGEELGKKLDLPEATIRAFVNENQAQDLRRALLENLKSMEDVLVEEFPQYGTVDDDFIAF